MAIYHLSVKTGRQYGSTGTRGANHYAYINRDGKYKRDDLENIKSGNLPSWATDAKHFWKSADKNERINGRVYTELEISLPRELNKEQREELVEKFVEKTLGENFTYSYAIQCPLASDGQQNPHVHLMFSERKLDGIERDEVKHFKRYNPVNPEKGGAGKDRYFSSKMFVVDTRLEWANHVNDFCENLGIDARIDHRSFKEQGIELSSQNFRADYVSSHKYHINENIKQVRHQNGEIIIERPSEAIKALTSNQSVFSVRELERFLMAHTDGEEQYLKAYESVITCPDMATLYGKDKVVFSSKELVGIEESISTFIYNANEESRIQKPFNLVEKLPLNAVRVAETRTFNSEQEKAFYTLTSTDRITLLNGSAGTGKSYVLSAVSEAYKESDYQVYGIALQAITAKAIANDCDIPSSTIASFLSKYDSGNLEINNKTVLILDEAGMVGSRDMQRLLMLVEKHDAQIKLVGDSYQLSAVSAGHVFANIQENLDKKNIASLEDIQRQKHAKESDKMIQASKYLSKHEVGKAIDIYKSINMVNEYESHDLALAKTVKSWSEDSSESKLMLAHSNSDVNELNRMARALLIKQGKLNPESVSVKNYQGDLDISIGEKIVFKQNNSQMKVSNGELAKVIGFEKDKFNNPKAMMVQMESDSRIVRVDLKEYDQFKHGYANTIHSSQGMTVDSAYIVASENMNANLTYVALTRHKQNIQINYSALTFATNEKETVKTPDGKVSYDHNYKPVEREVTAFENFKKVLGRSETKEFSTDFTLVESKDNLMKSYLNDHRLHLENKRELFGINSKLYSLTSENKTFTKEEIVSEVRASLKSKALLGDEIVKFNGNMNIAKGELVKLTNDLEIKTGLFKKVTFEKGTELKVIDAYKVKDKPVMKARIKNEEYEIPFNKLNLEYSDKYFNEFKDQSKARFDSRHKTEVYTEFREQLLKQKANAPKDNLNAPNQRIKNPNTPNRNTPKY
nr:AAA family ATPase [Acinetobacter pittii]